MRLTLFLLVVLLFTIGGLSAQSFFKPVPKVKAQASPITYRGILSTNNQLVISPDQPLPVPGKDSSVNAFRPIANMVAYAEPGNILMAGAGLSYQHLNWNLTTQKWYCAWSVSAMGWAGGSVAPKTPADAVSYGVMFGVLNNQIMVGPAINSGKAQAVISIGISFNN